MARGDLQAGLRLLRRLPAYLRRPVTVSEARAVVRQRLERREDDFLELARRAVYGGAPASPYRWLLARAGCEYADLERLVSNEGLEGTLHTLLRAGVYLTVEELKGRSPLLRSGERCEVRPEDLRNPLAAGDIPAQTSGSRGRPTELRLDLAWLRDWAVNTSLEFAAWGGEDRIQARWGVPGRRADPGHPPQFRRPRLPPAPRFTACQPGPATPQPPYSLDPNPPARPRPVVRFALPRPEHVPPEAP